MCFFGLVDTFVPQGIEVKREELKDGYKIIQTKPVRRIFEHRSSTNIEWLENNDKDDPENNGYYIDHDCNGLDTIYRNGWYQIGYPNTKKMFREGDKYFAKAKREMSVNDIK